jgi:hypothetical protein
MWLFTRYGFFSVTVSSVDPGTMQIRARDRGHLERLIERFPGELGAAAILETKDSDYRFRLIVKRSEWPTLAARLAADIDYGNFKSDAAKRFGTKSEYVHALHDVWGTMHGLQAKP